MLNYGRALIDISVFSQDDVIRFLLRCDIFQLLYIGIYAKVNVFLNHQARKNFTRQTVDYFFLSNAYIYCTC